MKYFRKDWILFQEVANEGGKVPEVLKPIELKEADAETNKHVPFIEETKDGYKVSVGKNAMHGTDAEHHTMFIELNIDDIYVYKYYIAQDSEPVFEFKVPKGKKVTAIAFCNLHGMFKNTL